MNEKFFDLTKEKQDRMINGAIKVFAENGYQHASTDDMVKVAGISKGLWFHYFGSKIGLYEFVCEYSVRYFCMELTSMVDDKEKDYYEIVRQMLGAMERTMKMYPYLPLFLYRIGTEQALEASEVTMLGREKIQNRIMGLVKGTEMNLRGDRGDREALRRIISYTLTGILQERYRDTELEAERMIREMKSYVNRLQSLTTIQRDGSTRLMEEEIETVAS